MSTHTLEVCGGTVPVDVVGPIDGTECGDGQPLLTVRVTSDRDLTPAGGRYYALNLHAVHPSQVRAR